MNSVVAPISPKNDIWKSLPTTISRTITSDPAEPKTIVYQVGKNLGKVNLQ